MDGDENDTSGQQTGGGTNTTDGGSGSGGTTFDPITSQEQLDKIVGQRVARERAKFSDYDAVKSKAAKFDEAESANKTELQKAIERAEAAEKKAAEAELGGLRSEVARTKGVPVGSVKGTTKEEMEASADELIAWRDGEQAAKSKQRKPVSGLKSGASSGDDNLSGKERAAAALRQMRSSS